MCLRVPASDRCARAAALHGCGVEFFFFSSRRRHTRCSRDWSSDVCSSDLWISSAGTYLTEFERAFARYCGAAEGIGTTSGTTALHVALAARGLGPGDEIIIPAFTIAATVFAALYVGATPVLVDVEPDTWTMRVDQVAARIGPRTRAVMPVHMYGHPCDMDPLTELARRHGLWLLEDAAEVHGAEYKGKKCGGLADAACFSFYANKIISTGEGGMVVTSDRALAERCRSLKNLGLHRDRRFCTTPSASTTA